MKLPKGLVRLPSGLLRTGTWLASSDERVHGAGGDGLAPVDLTAHRYVDDPSATAFLLPLEFYYDTQKHKGT